MSLRPSQELLFRVPALTPPQLCLSPCPCRQVFPTLHPMCRQSPPVQELVWKSLCSLGLQRLRRLLQKRLPCRQYPASHRRLPAHQNQSCTPSFWTMMGKTTMTTLTLLPVLGALLQIAERLLISRRPSQALQFQNCWAE